MLERMSDFFENRLDGYDEHMLTNIKSAREFYPFTAECLPKANGCRVLDLGCGTGLELEYYFSLNSTARVTGIDLSQGMLDVLSAKFENKDITLVCDSYFAVPLGENVFDSAVSVESLHHFTQKEKIPLYEKLCKADRKVFRNELKKFKRYVIDNNAYGIPSLRMRCYGKAFWFIYKVFEKTVGRLLKGKK